jgi:hypothetical protein
MIRLIGEGTHVGGADIEQMIGVGRVIGDPAPDVRALLDQRHIQVIGRTAKQMARQQHAACPAADNDHLRSWCASDHCIIATMFAVNRVNLGDSQSRRLREPRGRGESALDVGNNVVDVLDTDGKTDVPVGDAGCVLLFWR